MEYNAQVDDMDEPDEYYLLAKQHAEADALIRIGRTKPIIRQMPEERETYQNFTPKFQPVPTPANADEEWYKMIDRIQRLEERALHGDQ